MTTASDLSALSASSASGPRRTSIQAWRRRSRVIHGLRLLLPLVIGLILAGLAASVAYNALTTRRVTPGNANDPIRLINPHFVGRDARGRPFVLTSVTATRDSSNYNRVFLDKPVLVMDADGTDPLHITSGSGIYHEDTGLLEVSHGVRLSGARGAVDTDSSVFDTKTEELTGSVAVHGAGFLGEIQAKSYAVHDQGASMEFHGRVHTVLIPKKQASGH
ncbi:LPS export ABC transporter periplasmic protein LptC [Phenylobacterium sp.]|jgi:lipopolysaccharide export system protein LptC|uniref:LPS export ABC transporter periplasmic protein LptC n=1 Tax=Phenylobacterium sp. TaxID=1871053 RepID=UPI002F3FE278